MTYSLDVRNDCIRYTTARDIREGEELCIFYGHSLWFTPVTLSTQGCSEPETDDGWGGLTAVEGDQQDEMVDISNPYTDGDPEAILSEEDLPFTRLKSAPEEEDAQSIQTGDCLPHEIKVADSSVFPVHAWIVDVPDPRHITTLLKYAPFLFASANSDIKPLRWLKQAGLDDPELGHLKRIRKHGDLTSLLLSTTADSPQLPEDLNLPAPYLHPVPISAALTLPSLTLKSALWPTMYTPRRKDEPEPWTRRKVAWAWDAMKRTVDAATKARLENDEVCSTLFLVNCID